MPEGFADLSAFFFSCVHTLYGSICVFPVLFSFVIFVVSLRVCLSACRMLKYNINLRCLQHVACVRSR
jgi:hypothetical protein